MQPTNDELEDVLLARMSATEKSGVAVLKSIKVKKLSSAEVQEISSVLTSAALPFKKLRKKIQKLTKISWFSPPMVNTVLVSGPPHSGKKFLVSRKHSSASFQFA